MTSAATASVDRDSSARRPEDALDDDVVRVLRHDGEIHGKQPELSDGEVVELYRAMVRTRMFDDRAVTLQRQGRIGFHIGSLGEEATIVGSAFALRKQDWIFPCYREFGAALIRGMPAQRYWDNLYGNANDLVKGRQMPDHWCCRSGQLASVSSPIGTQITHAAGFAWAAKLSKDPIAVLVYFGDGATSSGEFHNGLNFAGVYKAPAIFLCRNNGWAISVPTERQTATATFAEKGIAYGVPGVRCDGNDVFAVIQVTREAVARAARGEGPTLIEALTYRLSGHSTSDDPKRYRPDEDVDPWQKLDPNVRMRAYLKERVGWSDGDQNELEESVASELKELVDTAEQAPPPPLASMFEDVFEEMPAHLREQREELLRGPRARSPHSGGHG